MLVLGFIAERQASEPSQAFDLILQRTPGKLKEFQPRSKCRVPALTTGKDNTVLMCGMST